MKKLPKSLYVKIETPEQDEPYPICGESFLDLNIETGDKALVGVYKLVGTYNAVGMIETDKLRPVKP
jgi:hypothetical protein